MLVQCPYCLQHHDVNPAAMLGSKKKTMTEVAINARRENGKKPKRKREEE